jgi:hypothetical protein
VVTEARKSIEDKIHEMLLDGKRPALHVLMA